MGGLLMVTWPVRDTDKAGEGDRVLKGEDFGVGGERLRVLGEAKRFPLEAVREEVGELRNGWPRHGQWTYSAQQALDREPAKVARRVERGHLMHAHAKLTLPWPS